jgi:hypothetical protein
LLRREEAGQERRDRDRPGADPPRLVAAAAEPAEQREAHQREPREHRDPVGERRGAGGAPGELERRLPGGRAEPPHLLDAGLGPREVVGEALGVRGEREPAGEERVDLRAVVAVRGVAAGGPELPGRDEHERRDDRGRRERAEPAAGHRHYVSCGAAGVTAAAGAAARAPAAVLA